MVYYAALPGLRADRCGQWLIIVFEAWCCATFQSRYPEILSALSTLWSTEPNASEPCHIINRNAFPLTVSRHCAALAMPTLHRFRTRSSQRLWLENWRESDLPAPTWSQRAPLSEFTYTKANLNIVKDFSSPMRLEVSNICCFPWNQSSWRMQHV